MARPGARPAFVSARPKRPARSPIRRSTRAGSSRPPRGRAAAWSWRRTTRPSSAACCSCWSGAATDPAAIRAFDEFARHMSQDLELEPSVETRAADRSDPLRRPQRRARGRSRPDRHPALLRSRRRAPGLPRRRYGGAARDQARRRGRDPHGGPAGAASLPGAAGPAPATAWSPKRAGGSRPTSARDASCSARWWSWASGFKGTASLYDARGRVVATASARRPPGQAELFDLVDELARQLLAAAGVGPGTRLTRIAALTTDSLDALRAYLLGERELRAGRYFDAMEGFQAAVEADPSFALAYYRLAAAAAGCALPDVARAFADQGYRAPRPALSPRSARLPGAAGVAARRGAGSRVAVQHDHRHLPRRRRGLVPSRRPAVPLRTPCADARAWRPARPSSASCGWTRITSAPWFTSRGSRGSSGRRDDMLALAERVQKLSPEGDQALAMRALCVFAGEDRAAMAALAEELQSARALTVAIAFADVARLRRSSRGRGDAGAELHPGGAVAGAAGAVSHPPRAPGAGDRAGRRDAAAELAQASALDSAWGLEMRALFATLPFLDTPRDELARLRAELEAWDAEVVPPSMFWCSRCTTICIPRSALAARPPLPSARAT